MLGQTPLHLAAGWPFATRKLLHAGSLVTIKDNSGCYPIDYTSSLDDLESLQLLLDADSYVSFPTREEAMEGDNMSRKGEEVVMTTSKRKKFDLFLKALINRRTRLADIARKALPSPDFSRLIESSPGLLDKNAAEVYKLIKDMGYFVPFALKIPRYHSTVFHHPLIISIEMERLYQAGFREIDSTSKEYHHKTPLMSALGVGCFRSADNMRWLLSKGANPMKRVDSAGNIGPYQINHITFRVMGWIVYKFRHLTNHGLGYWSNTEELCDAALEKFTPYIRVIFQNSHPLAGHICQCLCSQSSCTPFNSLLQHVWKQVRVSNFKVYSCKRNCKSGWRKPPKYAKSASRVRHPCLLAFRYPLAFFGDWLLRTLYAEEEIPASGFAQIVRTFLFAELDLTHTCCKNGHRFSDIPPEDVREIQDEEKELISKLEDLCAEAEQRRRSYQGTFCDFLMDFVHEIDEWEEKKVGIEDAGRLREIGVVLDPACIEGQ